MPADLKVEILPSEVEQIVEAVFGTMMSLEVAVRGTPWFPGGDRLTSAVQLVGDWSGAVLLECGQEQACRFAGRFLSTDPPGAADNVARDVLGELANMIGGNLKCVLAKGTRLSMPSVVNGSDYSLRVCGAVVQDQLAFECAEGPFWVTILTTHS